MSDEYTPTTEEIIQAVESGTYNRVNYGLRRMPREELFRWLERERENALLDGRIEERERADRLRSVPTEETN